VSCHNQGGVGGSGSKAHNVDLLTLIPPITTKTPKPDNSAKIFAEKMARIHPGFRSSGGSMQATVTLHQFSTNHGYGKWRETLLALVDELPVTKSRERVGFEIDQRRAPALFGAGLIDSIPIDVLISTAQEQEKRSTVIHGQVARSTDGQTGKF